MEASQLGQGRGRGSIILRMLGLAVFVVGLHGLLSVLSQAFPVLQHLPTISGLTNQGYVLGVWLVQGRWAAFTSVVLGVLYLFGGFQLLRLRRGGWMVCALVLAYAGLSTALWWATGQLEVQLGKAVRAAQEPGLVESLGVDFFLRMQAAAVKKVYRIAGFFFMLHCVPFVYLVTEWRRFWGKWEGHGGRFGSWSKALVGVLVLAGSAVWAFWGAEYVRYHQILAEAGSATPNAAVEHMGQLSLTHQRKVTAALVERLAAEQTDALAEAILSPFDPPDISLLTAEDIAPLITAARNPSAKVREACFSLFARIGTTETEKCLREALSGPQDETWKAAVRALKEMRPGEAPETVLNLAQDGGENRRFCLWSLGGFRDPRVVPILIKALRDEDAEVRGTAASALGEQPGEPSERALWEALRDESISVRTAAVWGLNYIGTADSVGPLIGVLKSAGETYNDPSVASEQSLHEDAVHALRSLTGNDFGTGAAGWQKWWAEAKAGFNLEQNLVGRLFTPLPPPPEHPFESRAQAESDPSMKAFSAQGQAIRAIRSRDLRALAPELARYLRTPVDQAALPYLAADVLAEWGYREGIEWMIGFLDDDGGPGGPMFAISTLGRVCKVNFFSDKKRWRQWWEANRSRFAQAAPGPEGAP